MVTYSRSVFYYETDRMSIVHHSNYLRMFEEARLHYIEESSMDYHELEKLGVIIPVTGVELSYEKSLQYGDKFHVEVKMIKFNGVKMDFAYKLYIDGDDKPAVTGKTMHCFLDDATRMPIILKRKMPELYDSLKALVEE